MAKISCWIKVNGICIEEKRCSYNSCRVDCNLSEDGFCCIDHSTSNRLLEVLELQPIVVINDEICLTEAECKNFPYFARCVWTNNQSISPYNCRPTTFTFYRSVNVGTTSVVAVDTGLTETGCGSTRKIFDMTTNLGQILFRVGAISLNGTIIRAATKPSDEPEIY